MIVDVYWNRRIRPRAWSVREGAASAGTRAPSPSWTCASSSMRVPSPGAASAPARRLRLRRGVVRATPPLPRGCAGGVQSL